MRRELCLAGVLSILAHWGLTQLDWPDESGLNVQGAVRELEVSILAPAVNGTKTKSRPTSSAQKAEMASQPKSVSKPEAQPEMNPKHQNEAKANSQFLARVDPKPPPEEKPKLEETEVKPKEPEVKPTPNMRRELEKHSTDEPVAPSRPTLQPQKRPPARTPNKQEAERGTSSASPKRHSEPTIHSAGFGEVPDTNEQRVVSIAHGDSAKGPPTKEAVPCYDINPAPTYPEVARRRGYEGTVLLRIGVQKDGSVEHANIARSSGYKILDQAALKAVRSWRFIPGKRGDEPCAMDVRVPITFRLQ